MYIYYRLYQAQQRQAENDFGSPQTELKESVA
jgi:hypothetical protein